MSKKNKYPSGWSIYSYPRPPQKPEQFYKSREVIKTFKVGSYESIDVSEFAGAGSIYLESHTDGYGDTTIEVSVQAPEKETEDPHYAERLKKYKREYKKYEAQMAEWQKWKDVYDKEQADLKKKADRATYERLKKEFEGV